MQASSSIEAEIRRWAKAFQAKDPSILQDFSKQPGAIALGTDPHEWWPGYDRFVEVGTAQMTQMPDMTFELTRISASEEGTVGWGVADAVLTFAGMKPLPSRLTVVCHREDGAWKAVLWQLAFGVPNEEVFASQLTT